MPRKERCCFPPPEIQTGTSPSSPLQELQPSPHSLWQCRGLKAFQFFLSVSLGTNTESCSSNSHLHLIALQQPVAEQG